ncbi:MAG: hypothetical protein KME08_14985 [Aphanothece sp. CMT-3BRIN-NPC111]|nr:hypothetical protein [Aphanothece sp. CMT-3BRIN-NPC111]
MNNNSRTWTVGEYVNDGSIREYWDETENLLVDRDVNAAINIKRLKVVIASGQRSLIWLL